MELYDIPYVLAFVLAARAWWINSQVREQAVKLAKQACEQEKVQLLDASVSLKTFRIERSKNKMFYLLRYYKFEFSVTGSDRRIGTIALWGMRQQYLVMDLPENTTIDVDAE